MLSFESSPPSHFPSAKTAIIATSLPFLWVFLPRLEGKERIPTIAKPRLLLLILFLWFLEYGMVWYTVSWYFFPGWRGWSQFQRQQNPRLLSLFFFPEYPRVWYGFGTRSVHRPVFGFLVGWIVNLIRWLVFCFRHVLTDNNSCMHLSPWNRSVPHSEERLRERR